MPFDLVIKERDGCRRLGLFTLSRDVAVKERHDCRDREDPRRRRTTIDADGLFVTPGIIDTHTHYDAQPFWDKLCTSSIWHGVTTVLMGNCGLTLAPLRPEHRETMLATFCWRRGPAGTLAGAVTPWNWETFGEYLTRSTTASG